MSKRPVQIDDLARLEIPGSIQISNDAERVVWVQRYVDADGGRTCSRLWGWRDGELAPLTEGGPVTESAPRISPDGHHQGFLTAPSWAPDGSWIAALGCFEPPASSASTSTRTGSAWSAAATAAT